VLSIGGLRAGILALQALLVDPLIGRWLAAVVVLAVLAVVAAGLVLTIPARPPADCSSS